jgi:hypothetical protein
VYWERPQELQRFWQEQHAYGRGDGEASIKTPIAFQWNAAKKCPAALVPLLTGLRWAVKVCTIRGLFKAIGALDLHAALFILPLQFGNGYHFGRGYLVGNEYGEENCQACRNRLAVSAPQGAGGN